MSKVNYKKLVKKQNKEFEKEYQKRLDRCLPIAKEIMKMMLEAELPMGTFNDKKGEILPEIQDIYESFSAKVLAYMLNSGMNYMDKDFVFQLILQPFDKTREITLNAVNKSFEKAEEILFGKDILDVNFDDIHQLLLKNAEKVLKEKQDKEEETK